MRTSKMKIQRVIDLVTNIKNREDISFDDFKDLMEAAGAFLDYNKLTTGLIKYAGESYYENDELSQSEYDERCEELYALIDLMPQDKDIYETVEFVGGEGQGDSWHHVIKHISSGRYLWTDGYYASYNGYDDEGCSFIEVAPVKKTIIAYECV